MKRIFGVIAAVAFVSMGTTALAGELLDSGRIITAMEDQWQGHNYRNTHTSESFIASLKDNHPGYYRNIHTAESFVAALQDSHEGYYRNIHTAESFVDSLGDGYSSERYYRIMDSSRFAGLLAEKRQEEAETVAYTPKCGHRDIDYLATNVYLAKLSESCE